MPRLTRRTTLAALLAAPFAMLARPGHAETHAVTIEGFAYSPANLSVAAGDTVVFTNNDGAPHTATAGDGSFDTGRLNRGQSAEVTVSAAGEIAYQCTFHPNMRGTITAS